MGVLHRPRVAWEGGRIFAAAANADAYYWLSEMVGEHLGVIFQLKLAETRIRLQAEDVTYAEAGAWRARLDELLEDRPELTPLLHQLVTETADRMPR
ncbi:hypothetical protein [Actinomadura sp. HBU206391]|uniref:hypothetical protein n=1 Tax=Actinomadura sp. HBU206391 TaxID=2731692 RepID=UPI00164F9E2E|nr:hypothetical protein [Actinomadura sp. HBU206391]MBC6456434.1 hypothetical protein [Actinomadura sp. HBU206391]